LYAIQALSQLSYSPIDNLNYVARQWPIVYGYNISTDHRQLTIDPLTFIIIVDL
jgi:hypothetical protein